MAEAAESVFSGPPLGRYTCYQFGFNAQMFYNGVTVDILEGGKYTTEGSNFTGSYEFVSQGAKIIYVSGKLQGLSSWYRLNSKGKAIYIAFKNGRATNAAVCGIIHQ